METLNRVYELLDRVLASVLEPKDGIGRCSFPDRFGLEIYSARLSPGLREVTVFMYGFQEPAFQARVNGKDSTLIHYDPGMWLLPVLEDICRNGAIVRTRQ